MRINDNATQLDPIVKLALQRVEFLTRKEEHALYAHIQRGNARARDELVLKHLPLALKIAQCFHNKNPELCTLADALQEVVTQFTIAIDTWKPHKSRFSTYVKTVANHGLLNQILYQGRSVYVERDTKKKGTKIYPRATMFKSFDTLDMSNNDTDGSFTLVDTLASCDTGPEESSIWRKEIKELVSMALERMRIILDAHHNPAIKKHQADAFILRYGLDRPIGHPEWGQWRRFDTLTPMFKVTLRRIRQLANRVWSKLENEEEIFVGYSEKAFRRDIKLLEEYGLWPPPRDVKTGSLITIPKRP